MRLAGSASNQPEGRRILRNHRARGDGRIRPQFVAADDRRVCADCGAAPHERLAILGFAHDLRTRIVDVGAHAGRAAEHAVLKNHAFIDRDIVLDLHVIADRHPWSNDNILPNVAFLADDDVSQDVAEMPDPGFGSDRDAVIDESGVMHARALQHRQHPKSLGAVGPRRSPSGDAEMHFRWRCDDNAGEPASASACSTVSKRIPTYATTASRVA